MIRPLAVVLLSIPMLAWAGQPEPPAAPAQATPSAAPTCRLPACAALICSDTMVSKPLPGAGATCTTVPQGCSRSLVLNTSAPTATSAAAWAM